MTIIQLIKSLKPKRREHWMMLCILFYVIITPITYQINVSLPVINAIHCSFTTIFLCLMIFYMRHIPFAGWTRFFYLVMFVWSLWLTFEMFFLVDFKQAIDGYKGWTTFILTLFAHDQFIPNIMPFMLMSLASYYRFDFRYFFRLMWLLCILYICLYPFAFWSMTHYKLQSYSWADGYGDFINHSTIGISSLAPCAIMIFLKRYLSGLQWKCYLFSYIGSLLLIAFMARRGATVMSLFTLVMCWTLYTFSNKGKSRFYLVILFIILAFLGFVLFSNMADSFFINLINRGVEDSRTGVEESFYYDMSTTSDWIFGRGWLGTYYDPLFGFYRPSIETGYLTMILRGGLIYFIPYIAILSISAIKGIFNSGNLICKAFGIICFIHILRLYPSGIPFFDFYTFCLWLGIWVCNNEYYRNLSDDEVEYLLFR